MESKGAGVECTKACISPAPVAVGKGLGWLTEFQLQKQSEDRFFDGVEVEELLLVEWG